MNTKDKITQMRKRSKLSQAEFGALVGFSGGAVSRWESGNRTPPNAIIELLEIKLKGV